ncbi:shikimate dehydrogenase family protein [Angustibacter sp. McL0619]|uniref:shikimate dehydrogenase family protein n=1 Tax=Angustibacter sp. McL0619 TaxID=3415676 RepID=UPI003CF22929
MAAQGPFVSTITGSFSHPAGDNPTVAMVEAAYRHHELDARYLNCDVRDVDLAAAVRGAVAMGWAGFNCSIPHKLAVIEHLDELAESAGLIGAVNCVVLRGGRLVGENTDGQGFVASLAGVVDLTGARVVVLGSGGAARAVAVESALAGALSVDVVSRSAGPGRSLVEVLRARTGATSEHAGWDGDLSLDVLGHDVDVLVNATPIGLGDAEARVPLDLASVPPSCVVADVIPNPPRTRLLRDASARGCRTVDGLGMLVAQAAHAIRLWTGLEPDQAVMRAALERALGQIA